MVYFENSKVSITIYKSLARPHLDYGDIICNQTFNESFHQRIESKQYAVIAITGIIGIASSKKLLPRVKLRVTKIQRMAQEILLILQNI